MGYIEDRKRELEKYLPPLTRKPDFDLFWEQSLEESRRLPLGLEVKRLEDYPAEKVHVYDISYQGMENTRIHGWYLAPRTAGGGRLPCVIQYHGFSGSRGMPSDHLFWTALGMAVLAVDCRGQGGITADHACYQEAYFDGPACRGILDPHEYYYRHVYLDSVRAVDAACAMEETDRDRIVLHGISQGGALVMAAAALDRRPAAALADVPGNSDLAVRVEGEYGSFGAAAAYLRRFPQHTDTAFGTLSYFDTMNLASRITCPVLCSVSLKDKTCPAECFFATYNRIESDKQIEIYPFCGHENAYSIQMEKKLVFLRHCNIIGSC